MDENPRQRVERVPGSRRARLTPVPGTETDMSPARDDADEAVSSPASSGPSGPNDERLRQDVPPHY